MLNVAYKILSSILVKRLIPYTEEVIEEYQCGFRPGRSTTDQILSMQQTMENAYEYRVDLHVLFIDFKQAFDSVDRRRLLEVLETFGFPRRAN